MYNTKKLYCIRCGKLTKHTYIGRSVTNDKDFERFANIATFGVYKIAKMLFGPKYYRCNKCKKVSEE